MLISISSIARLLARSDTDLPPFSRGFGPGVPVLAAMATGEVAVREESPVPLAGVARGIYSVGLPSPVGHQEAEGAGGRGGGGGAGLNDVKATLVISLSSGRS